MTLLADLLSSLFDRRYRTFLPGSQDSRPMEELIAALIGSSGEVTGSTIARSILDRYTHADEEEKKAFFRFLAEDFAVSAADLRAALETYEKGQSKASYRALMHAAEPKRQELIRRLNQVPDATRLLVEMREDLLKYSKSDDALQALDVDFQHLFASWFNRGFLVLRPINWESPANILEKIIQYEAVHAIHSWDDLRRRLAPADRRCFAFFHPAMPDEPLIFVEVALTKGVPSSVQNLLSEERDHLDEGAADTAVFYSISNCQAGLAGISFGNSLIKQVAADLSLEVPSLKTFVTLSPIPGFRAWFEKTNLRIDEDDPKQLKALAAHYLIAAKRKDGLPLDPVARFHLGNGAQVHQVHADADTSDKGQRQSAGVMVNYLYNLAKVSQNHERFATSHEIAASSDIKSLSAAAEKHLDRSPIDGQPAL